jgi:hypothetical protein
VKPVKDEPKIIVELRPDQLASLIDALGLASECEQEDAECLNSMDRVNAQCVADTVARQDKYAKLAAWMQHVQEEAE